MAKPGSLPRWSETAGGTPSNIVEPASGKKDVGWLDNERPPAKWWNWWKNLVYLWIKYLDTIHTEPFTGATSWTALHTFTKKVTVTAGVGTNHPGLDGTGDGSGAGVKGTGGDTAGTPGVLGAGGVGGGPGVKGTAIGAYPGLDGTGSSNAAGVKGTGGAGGGSGVEGVGGSGGAGGSFTGGGTNANGVVAIGVGTGTGVICSGAVGLNASASSASGAGIIGAGGSTSGNGATLTGGGSGSGLNATGGATGKGVVCNGGATSGAAIEIGKGHAVFTGTQPAINDLPAAVNMATALQIAKAWGMLEKDNAGVATFADGINIDTAAVSVTATHILVTLKRAMADVNYGVGVTNQSTANHLWSCDHLTKTTSTFRLTVRDADTGSALDPTGATVMRCFFEVKGRQ